MDLRGNDISLFQRSQVYICGKEEKGRIYILPIVLPPDLILSVFPTLTMGERQHYENLLQLLCHSTTIDLFPHYFLN